jgi:GNAT superfamily N-acetyltransferase
LNALNTAPLLQNEISFDRLFCDVFASDLFSIYYNIHFSDDPIFNHVTFSDSILDSENYSSGLEVTFRDIVDQSNMINVPSSLFVERYWKNARGLEQDAVDFGFVVVEQMHVLSKKVPASPTAKNSRITVAQTRDVRMWNEAFVKSFDIPETWTQELANRLMGALADPDTILLVAREEGMREASGCILLHVNPRECLGVYCVGTIPERRSHGVASGMLAEAESQALKRNCETIVLQTVASDGVTPMYLNMGFETAFERDVLQFR